ncbi:MAG: hypothetical protein OXP73_10805 [Chloroflexota bacterium]|nr:hypothetical protein [Chloroflexota bacterium]
MTNWQPWAPRWLARRLALAALVAAAAVITAWTPAAALDCQGIVLDDGCLFTITGSDTPDPDDGYAVTNDHGVPFYDFVRARDVQSIGYPISQRWNYANFTLQAFQKVILQWDPGKGRVNYHNTLDVLANRYPEVELPNVPPHQVLETDADADFASAVRTHLALLDRNAAMKERFLSEPAWLSLYGLPIRYEEREVDGHPQGLQLLRTQRTVFEIWNVAAPGTTVGRVNLQNVPDKVKRLDNVIIPNTAKGLWRASDPRYPALIANLRWVADGLEPWEQRGVSYLERIFAVSEPALRSLVQHPTDWTIRNGPYEDAGVTGNDDFEMLALLVEQPWAKHELNFGEDDLIDIVRYGLDSLPALVTASDSASTPAEAPDPNLPGIISSLYWVADGLTPLEQTAVTHLAEIFAASEPLLQTLIQDPDNAYVRSRPTQATIPGLKALVAFADLPWATDGLNQTETELLRLILINSSAVPDLASLVPQKQWIKDDLTDDEFSIIDDLISIGYDEREILKQTSSGTNEATIAYHLLRMPFLASIEPFDAPAVRSLRDIGWHDRNYLHTIVARYAQPDGITDYRAKIIPTLSYVVANKPELLNGMLNPAAVSVEERSIVLPHTGPVVLAVIRTRLGDDRTMAYLDEAVRFAEGFIRRPFPTRYIALHVTEAVEPWGGLFLGSHIAIREGYDDQYHYFNDSLRGVLYHEVAHYYWHACPSWLCEGAAVYFEMHAGVLGSGAQKGIAEACSTTSIIDVASEWNECDYYLGAALFFNLFHSLGEGVFLRGLWRLYDTTQGNLSPGSCEGIEVGLCHLRFAFVTDAPPEAAALAERFLRELYFGED